MYLLNRCRVETGYASEHGKKTGNASERCAGPRVEVKNMEAVKRCVFFFFFLLIPVSGRF